MTGNKRVISAEHESLLQRAAICADAAEAAGVRSYLEKDDLPPELSHLAEALPGIVFPWLRPSGGVVHQYRPDTPTQQMDGTAAKYLFPAGTEVPLNVHPWMRDAVGNVSTPLAIIEGTKQHLAAVSALGRGAGHAVVGMSGCWGWSRSGGPSADLLALPVRGRSVIVVMDADLRSNPSVYEAAERLADTLKCMQGAREVKFVHLPAGGKCGLDDLLAPVEPGRRGEILRTMLESATERLGAKPKKRTGTFTHEGSILPRTIAEDICAEHDLAIGPDGELWAYRGGVFVRDPGFIAGQVTRRLGDDYRSTCLPSVRDMLMALLADQGRVLPDQPTGRWVNVANGMLDPLTEELVPHDPSFLSVMQFPVEWDPQAQAPAYEAWMDAHLGAQRDLVEEALSQMLDPGRYPTKALLLYGPTRTGKSTLLRLAPAIAGASNTASVSLQQLSDDRFAAADLHGKALNVVADLSSAAVRDPATLKQVLGGDLIRGERKYGQPFTFMNRAVMAFSANAIPAMAENSGAVAARIVPVRMDASFQGREDQAVEDRLLGELPGILVLWARALRKRRQRGGWLPVDRGVQAEFDAATDPVKAFIDECTVPDPQGTLKGVVYKRYRQWSDENGHAPCSAKVLKERMDKHGLPPFRTKNGDRYPIRLRPGGGDGQPGVVSGGGSGGFSEKSAESVAVSPNYIGGQEVPGELTTSTTPTTGRVVLDLETGDASAMFTYRPRDEQGFVRLAVIDDRIVTDLAEVLRILQEADTIVGHNILGFDLPALARHHGADYRALAAKARDTLILARLADPPMTGDSRSRYDLDRLAAEHGLAGKLPGLKRLAEACGGYDRIPLDDPDYRAYALQDAAIAAALADRYPMTAYAAREHRVMAIAGQMRLNGIRVDVDLLQSRKQEKDADALRARDALLDLGMPGASASGKEAKAPWATTAGTAWIVDRFAEHGLDLPGRKTGKEQLHAATQHLPESHPLRCLVRLLDCVRGSNPYGHVADALFDGRVHPRVAADQSTGRWSITQPALTTLGKRGGLLRQRAVFVPEPGHVILVADLSQIDARSVAVHSQDSAYMDLFAPGSDLHSLVAAQVLGDPSRRDEAKRLNHSANYGAGATTLARNAGVSVPDAERFLRGMQEQFPYVHAWKRSVADRARAGNLLDNGFGRMLRVDPERAHTAAPAAIGQSCSRDLLMEGLLRMDDAGLTPYLRLVVHDEVVLSIPAGDYGDYAHSVLGCLQFAWAPNEHDQPIDITANIGKPGANWADAY